MKDPDETWRRIRDCVSEWRAALDYVEMALEPVDRHVEYADEMEVEVMVRVEGLITWLDKGGRVPRELAPGYAWPTC